MYRPREFRIDDAETLFAFMARHNFANLVTAHEGAPVATPLPFIVQPGQGERGTLVAHMARANPQWRTFDGQAEALVIFQGPHAYVTPSWYSTHPSVPTWNYMTVQAYGKPRLIEDDARVRDVLRALIHQQEAAFEQPWRLDVPEAYMSSMVRAIVAFEIPLSRLEGKFKLSQNRDSVDRASVAAHLALSEDPGLVELSGAMQAVAGPADPALGLTRP